MKCVAVKKGQSMVEYALGLGCVAAVCMVALGGLGHICGDMIFNVQSAINYGGDRPGDPGRMVNNAATPWQLQ
ncbi:MAG: hypothetical protein K2X27_24115 [Candidatus Obscuribacterales bacterium]|nr:hypothetical protein [Candidatus Obscuribacterales bacterium]